jgi:acyl-CoA synthetase (AMP-forming)/AMP-acid ligase II/acyl carrier protein
MGRSMAIRDLVNARAESHPDALAVLGVEERTLTYRQLQRQMRRIAAALRVEHVERTDRVVTVLRDGLDAAVGFLGTASCAIAVPLSPDLGRGEFEYRLNDLDAGCLLVERGLDTAASAAANECGVKRIEYPFPAEDPRPDRDVEDATSDDGPLGDDVALILYTSGTTSIPKRVPLTHANLVGSATNVAVGLALSSEDRCLNVMPLSHVHGLVAGLLSSLVSGGSVVCVPGYGGSGFLDWLERYHPTWYTAVPTIHQSLLSEMDDRGISEITSHSLRLIRSSSAPLPTDVMEALEDRLGVPVIEAYGMTEAAHQIASNPLPPHVRKPRSVGRASGVEVAVLGPEGQVRSENTEGEIVIRGETVTSGYESDDEANASAFVNGWFRTGDAGYVDHDGYITLTGRMKEMINRGGEKLAPREIDDALLEHPAVARAIAFAIPHRTLGEDVAAAVVLRDGAEASETNLRGYLLGRLAAFKVPSRFVFVDELPVGPTGKPQRIGLADTLAGKLAEPFRPPGTPVETSLAQMWREVLHVDRVGAADNFFLLGGDSLSAARVLTRVDRRFGVRLTLRRAFESPRLEDLAIQVELRILDSIEGRTDD